MASKRRIFIAINLPENIKSRIKEFQTGWDIALSQNGIDSRRLLRWTKRDSLHMTLVFVGYADDEETYEICRLTRESASKKEPFSIFLEKIIYGPMGSAPRMIWLKGRCGPEATELKRVIEEQFENSEKLRSFRPERRDFSPHITLARMKEIGRGLEILPPLEKDFRAVVSVSSVEVMESELRGDGAEYIILESCPLGT